MLWLLLLLLQLLLLLLELLLALHVKARVETAAAPRSAVLSRATSYDLACRLAHLLHLPMVLWHPYLVETTDAKADMDLLDCRTGSKSLDNRCKNEII